MRVGFACAVPGCVAMFMGTHRARILRGNRKALFVCMRSDFRAGLGRVARLGKQVFSASEALAALEIPRSSRWRLLAGAGLILTFLLVAAWYTGRQSAGLEAQRVSAELNQLAQQLASTQLALTQQKARSDQVEKALKGSDKTARLALESQLRRQLLQAQAEASQYKAILDREHEAYTNNSLLIDALTNPGARLLALKGTPWPTESIAYALIVENTRLMFIGSKLPQIGEGRVFQLWIVRKQDPKFVSAGVFKPNDDKPVLMSFDDGSVLSDIASIAVTEEPDGGSATPRGTKLLESATGAAEPGRSRIEEPSTSEANPRVESSPRYRGRGTSR
jgi:Anti-sigma-K factor rskA